MFIDISYSKKWNIGNSVECVMKKIIGKIKVNTNF